MFPVMTLKQLAAQKIVDNFLNLGWKIPYPINTESTIVIMNALPKDSKTKFIRQNNQNLKIRKVDFLREKNVKKDVEMIRSLVLDSLTLGDLSDLVGLNQTPLDIVEFLKNVLNEKSRQRISHLNVGNGVKFKPNWLEKVLELVPNLQSLAVQNKETSYLPDFFDLSKTFELVSILDLSNITISSLEGISNFPNLEKLILYNTEIEEAEESMGEISKLHKLRELDISRYASGDPDGYLVNAFIESCDSFPELRFIDCSGTEIEGEIIEKIQEIAPKLETIALYMSDVFDDVPDSLQCLDMSDLRSTIQLYRYLESKNKIEQMGQCVSDMKFLIENEFGEHGDCPIFHEFLLFLCELLDSSVEDSHFLADCFEFYSKHLKQFLNNQEKLKVASTLIRATSRIKNERHTEKIKETCWFVIYDLNIVSIPGAPDMRSLILVSIFEDHFATKEIIDMWRTLVMNETSQIFKEDRNHAFWIKKSVRVMDSMKPPYMFTGKELSCYEVFIDFCNDFLNVCHSEIDIEEVIILISHLELLHFGYHENYLHSVTKVIQKMIILVDKRNLRRIPKDLIVDLFKKIHGDLIRFNENSRSFLENERARCSMEILKYILSSMPAEDFENIREEELSMKL